MNPMLAVSSGCTVSYSSSYDSSYENSNLDSSRGWAPRMDEDGQWAQVGCTKSRLFTGAVLQGRGDGDQWVKTVTFATSQDGLQWTMVDHGKAFPANFDRHSQVRINFNNFAEGRFLRVYPKTWHNWPSLRFDVWSLEVTLINWDLPWWSASSSFS